MILILIEKHDRWEYYSLPKNRFAVHSQAANYYSIMLYNTYLYRRRTYLTCNRKLVGGEDSGKGSPEQNWMDCLKDDFQTFGTTDGSTVDNRLTFEIVRAVWTLAAKMDDGAPWHKGVLQGAEKFITSWHKEEEEASRRRATKRDFRGLEPPHICR